MSLAIWKIDQKDENGAPSLQKRIEIPEKVYKISFKVNGLESIGENILLTCDTSPNLNVYEIKN